MEMDSWYYFCDVEEAMYERSLDDYEREYGYQVICAALEEMIRKNEAADAEKTPWSVQEAMVMRELARMEERDLFQSGRREVTEGSARNCNLRAERRRYNACQDRRRERPGDSCAV